MRVNKAKEVEHVEEETSQDTEEFLNELSEHLVSLRTLAGSLEDAGLDGVASKVADIADELETTLESIIEY